MQIVFTICMKRKILFSGKKKNKWIIINLSSVGLAQSMVKVNPGPAEPGYALPLQTVQIQISWLLENL